MNLQTAAAELRRLAEIEGEQLKREHDLAYRQGRYSECPRIINRLIDLGIIKGACAPWPRNADDRDFMEEETGEMR